MKQNIAEFWQYFFIIICNILLVIWQDFVIVGQNTMCTLCYPAMAFIPHWWCWTVLPDGVTQHSCFTKMM